MMDRNRLWVLGSIVVMVAIVVLGWFLGISPQLQAAAAADASRAQVEAQNSAYEQKLATLKKQFENIGELKTELAGLRQAVPGEADIPAFVGQLDAISKQHDVRLSDISVSDGEPYAPPKAAATPAPAAASGGSGAATPAPTPAAPAAPATPSAPAATTSSLVTADNFVAIPVSVTVHGDYGHVLDFIEGMQKGTRLVLVTGFSTTGQPSGGASGGQSASSGAVTGTISALVYVLLDPATSTAPATPAAGAATGTQAAG